MDDLRDKPIGFLYSKPKAREKMNRKWSKAMTRGSINWRDPTAEDIAAGLNDEQCEALIQRRPDCSRSPHWTGLTKPVPGWREALIITRGVGAPAILTAMGEKVRNVLLAQRCAQSSTGDQ